MSEENISACRTNIELPRLLDEELRQLTLDRERAARVFLSRMMDPDKPTSKMPVNIERLLWRTARDFKTGPRAPPSSLDPASIILKVGV